MPFIQQLYKMYGTSKHREQCFIWIFQCSSIWAYTNIFHSLL